MDGAGRTVMGDERHAAAVDWWRMEQDGGDQAVAWAALLACGGVGERWWRRRRSKSGG